MSTMTHDGYTARITFDSELDQFRGEIVGLNGGADFYGKTPAELRREFRKSLKVYLEVCHEKGINPRRQFSGRFNLRINPELHERLATLADTSGESLNALVETALTKVVHGIVSKAGDKFIVPGVSVVKRASPSAVRSKKKPPAARSATAKPHREKHPETSNHH